MLSYQVCDFIITRILTFCGVTNCKGNFSVSRKAPDFDGF